MCVEGSVKELVLLALALGVSGNAVAQSQAAESSSSAEAPNPGPAQGPAQTPARANDARLLRPANRPFRSVAIEFKAGVAGVGFDLATPLCSFANLRGGAQFFSHELNPNANGLHTVGELTLQNVQVSVDLFPFRRSSFHVSPGITVHNDNHLFSSIFVRPGGAFSLGDADYVSDPSNPISGYSRFKLGNTVAPRLTAGFGNMLPRQGHFSVPVEVGFQYISSPSLDLHLYGNACDSQGNCGDINSTSDTQNLASEVQLLNHDIAGLRFYPVFSVGLSYKIGH